MITYKFCYKSLNVALHGFNRARDVCNARWGSITQGGQYGKCAGGGAFRTQEEAGMKAHVECHPDDVQYERYEGCVRDPA